MVLLPPHHVATVSVGCGVCVVCVVSEVWMSCGVCGVASVGSVEGEGYVCVECGVWGVVCLVCGDVVKGV